MNRGRREKPISVIDGPVAEFATSLRDTRKQAGNPTYRQMAERVHYSAPALSQAASGTKLPTWQVAAAFLNACGVTDLQAWENNWNLARISIRLSRAKTNNQNRRYPSPHAAVVSTPRGRDGVDGQTDYLLRMLDNLRVGKRLSLRAVASKSRQIQAEAHSDGRQIGRLSSTTIHEVLSSRRRLDEDFITLYLLAIDASEDEQREVGIAVGRLEFQRHQVSARRAMEAFIKTEPVDDMSYPQQHIALPGLGPVPPAQDETAKNLAPPARFSGRAAVPPPAPPRMSATPKDDERPRAIGRAAVQALSPPKQDRESTGDSGGHRLPIWPEPAAAPSKSSPVPAPAVGSASRPAAPAQPRSPWVRSHRTASRFHHTRFALPAWKSRSVRQPGRVRPNRSAKTHRSRSTQSALAWLMADSGRLVTAMLAIMAVIIGSATLSIGFVWPEPAQLVFTAVMTSPDIGAQLLIGFGAFLLVLDLMLFAAVRPPKTTLDKAAQPAASRLFSAWRAFSYAGRHRAQQLHHSSTGLNAQPSSAAAAQQRTHSRETIYFTPWLDLSEMEVGPEDLAPYDWSASCQPPTTHKATPVTGPKKSSSGAPSLLASCRSVIFRPWAHGGFQQWWQTKRRATHRWCQEIAKVRLLIFVCATQCIMAFSAVVWPLMIMPDRVPNEPYASIKVSQDEAGSWRSPPHAIRQSRLAVAPGGSE